MRNIVLKSAVLLLLITILIAPSYAQEWSVPDHGFTIDIETPDGIAQKSGSTAKIAGRIDLVGAKLQGKGNGKSADDFHWKPNTHQKEIDVSDFNDLLRKDGIEIKAFFPDFSNEVTSGVALRAQGNGLDFNFETPALRSEDPNLFIIQVLHHSPAFASIQKIQAKIDRRSLELNRRLGKLPGKGMSELELAELRSITNQLKTLSAKIARKLISRVETLAEAKFALQVDNVVSGPSYSNTVMNKFRLSVEFDNGSAIQGQPQDRSQT